MFNFAQHDDGLDGFLTEPAKAQEPRFEQELETVAPAPRHREKANWSLPKIQFRHAGMTGPALAALIMLGAGSNVLFLQEGSHPAPYMGSGANTLQAADRAVPKTLAQVPLPTARPSRIDTTGSLAVPMPTPVPVVGPHVVELQDMLTRLGYYDGARDGIAGTQTLDALKRYEADSGLVATGDISDPILEHVRLTLSRQEARATLAVSMQQPEAAPKPPVIVDEGVARIQRVLAQLGYAPGPIDGQIGPGTRQAIESFERDYNLPPRGQLDDAFIQSLQELSGVDVMKGA